jgi:hypothetical protein
VDGGHSEPREGDVPFQANADWKVGKWSSQPVQRLVISRRHGDCFVLGHILPPFSQGVDERLPQSAQGETVTWTLKIETAKCSKTGIHREDYMVLQYRSP